jgi:DNA-binding NarL/FixJ family response regulator
METRQREKCEAQDRRIQRWLAHAWPINTRESGQPSAKARGGGCERVRVLLAEDHTIVRHALRVLLEGDEGIEVVGEAKSGREAVEMWLQLEPEIVLMDIAMPCLNGLEATKQILKVRPAAKVLVLSSYTDDVHVQRFMDAGAIGYLAKHCAADELISAVWEAHRGNAAFSEEIGCRLRENLQRNFVDGLHASARSQQLTSRELEVLQLIAEGYANKQTAAELAISIKTVEKHRQRIMDKLDIHQTAGLTRYAINHGIIEKTPLATVAYSSADVLHQT